MGGGGHWLRRLLFSRKFNRFDVVYILSASLMLGTRHWLIAISALIVGACISVSGEQALERSEGAQP